jgi:hypothetical protein
MMKDNLTRLMLSIAALELSPRELHRVMTELQSMPPEEISGRIHYLRKSIPRHIFDDFRIRFSSDQTLQLRNGSVEDRVERLLKVEAGLSTAEAIEKLTERLVENNMIERKHVPTLSRKSFRDWVMRLSRRIPPKDILQAATILRNQYVHGPVNDWMLRP